MSLSRENQQKIEAFWNFCLKNQYFNIGYPESADFDYSQLERFMRFSLNNCGDWSEACNYLLNTFEFEREVMQHFAQLFRIPFEQSWGYVTNGGTEGNLFGCYLARELYPDSTLFYSRQTHYSVAKIVRLLRMPSQRVETLPNGEMDYQDLAAKVRARQQAHPVIFANLGTTVLGAVDDLAKIRQALASVGLAPGQYYLHGDAALSGMILPFVDDPQPHTFADGLDSISVSGHKMIGSPIPCGVVLARKSHVDQISVEIDYIAAHDKTITGSRNGLTPLLLWYAIKNYSFAEQKARIQRCLAMADYAVARFRQFGVEAWRNKNSITVVFPCPSEAVWRRHGLATSGDYAHLITTAHHADSQMIDDLIADVVADRALTLVSPAA